MNARGVNDPRTPVEHIYFNDSGKSGIYNIEVNMFENEKLCDGI